MLKSMKPTLEFKRHCEKDQSLDEFKVESIRNNTITMGETHKG